MKIKQMLNQKQITGELKHKVKILNKLKQNNETILN